MELRRYRTDDWATVCEIYDRSKPDELRGIVDPSAILPLDADPNMKALFRDSRIIVMEDADRAFSPDEKILYVVESHATPHRLIWAYDVDAKSRLSNKRIAVDASSTEREHRRRSDD